MEFKSKAPCFGMRETSSAGHFIHLLQWKAAKCTRLLFFLFLLFYVEKKREKMLNAREDPQKC